MVKAQARKVGPGPVAGPAFPQHDVGFLQHVANVRTAGHQADQKRPDAALAGGQFTDELLQLLASIVCFPSKHLVR